VLSYKAPFEAFLSKVSESREVIGLKILSIREEATTDIELRAIAAPASIGSSLN